MSALNYEVAKAIAYVAPPRFIGSIHHECENLFVG
jgi:hypothetical protein